jgi:CBS domain-containing protein
VKDLTVLQAKRFGVYHCTTDTTLFEAAHRMVEEDISGLVVIDEEGYLKGIITRSDLMRAYASGAEWHEQTVEGHMSTQVVTVTPQERLSQVAQLLLDKQIHRVVIVHPEGGKLRQVGVISDADLVYHLTKEA